MKLELNVKHFNNEDVIATSDCSYVVGGYSHIYKLGSKLYWYDTDANGGMTKCNPWEGSYENDLAKGFIDSGVVEDGWYHFGCHGVWEKCEPTHEAPVSAPKN